MTRTISNCIEAFVAENVEKGDDFITSSHLFISYIAFAQLVKEYSLPSGIYKVDESYSLSMREMNYMTAFGSLKIQPVHEHAEFMMLGREDTYAQYNLENVIWGDK